MNTWDLIPVLLLMLLSISVASGIVIMAFVIHWRRQHSPVQQATLKKIVIEPVLDFEPSGVAFLKRPDSWLAIRSRNLHSVQEALKLHNAKPCTWMEGLSTSQKLFIAPPIRGWILIVGSGLPDPGEDVDACFRFLVNLSRKLGQVQFFHASVAAGSHAWIRAESGRIERGYAWAGQTVWNQGFATRAERDLGLKCFQYFECAEFGSSEIIVSNVEKVPQLAARWSLDPAAIDEHLFDQAIGIAGEPSRLY